MQVLQGIYPYKVAISFTNGKFLGILKIDCAAHKG